LRVLFSFGEKSGGKRETRKKTQNLKKNSSSSVYINIACNIAGLSHPTFEREPIPFVLPDRHTNPDSLEAAVETALELLGKAVKPVLVGGVKLRAAHRREAFERLAERSGFATAIMPNAKGMVSEKLERFLGVYWGQVRIRSFLSFFLFSFLSEFLHLLLFLPLVLLLLLLLLTSLCSLSSLLSFSLSL
jgi:hypothetical protein